MNTFYWLLISLGVTISIYSIFMLPEWLRTLNAYLERKIQKLQAEIDAKRVDVVETARAAIVRRTKELYAITAPIRMRDGLTARQAWLECLHTAFHELELYATTTLKGEGFMSFLAIKDDLDPAIQDGWAKNSFVTDCPDAVGPNPFDVEKSGL